MLKNQYNTDKSAMVNRNDEGAPSQDTVLVFQGVLSGTVYCAESLLAAGMYLLFWQE